MPDQILSTQAMRPESSTMNASAALGPTGSPAGRFRRHARALGVAACLAFASLAHAAPATLAQNDDEAIDIPAPAASRSARTPLPNVPLTADILYRVLAAEISLQRGLVGPSYRTYMDLARETRDPRLAQRATEIAFNARASQQALDAARLWTELAPKSPAARQVLSTLLVLSARWEEAEPLLSQQLALAPANHRGEAILLLQQQMSRTSDPAGAVGVLQRITASDTKLAETHLALARAREAAGDSPGALTELDQALRIKPDLEAAALMSAELQAEAATDKSIEVLKRFLAKSPSSVNGHITLARLYLQKNDMEAARTQFEVLRKVAPNDPRVPLALGLTSLQARSYDEAERYLKEYLQMAEKSPAANPDVAYQYLAQIAEEKKDYATAITWLDRIDDSRLATAAQAKRGQLLSRMGRFDDSQAVFGELLADAEDIPDPAQRAQRITAIRQAEVAAMLDGKAYDRARKVLDERVKAEPDNADWIYELAMLDEREKRYDHMEARLRRVIALQPEQKQGYNALGYSLADRNERLPEARKLLERATELGPDDPYIMDSLGWVKYRQGELQPAADLLRTAYAKAPEAEIGAHLGEVLWHLGQHEEARKTWNEAAKVEPDNQTLIETLRRYNQNMLLSR